MRTPPTLIGAACVGEHDLDPGGQRDEAGDDPEDHIAEMDGLDRVLVGGGMAHHQLLGPSEVDDP
jgi:hypothetical protein